MNSTSNSENDSVYANIATAPINANTDNDEIEHELDDGVSPAMYMTIGNEQVDSVRNEGGLAATYMDMEDEHLNSVGNGGELEATYMDIENTLGDGENLPAAYADIGDVRDGGPPPSMYMDINDVPNEVPPAYLNTETSCDEQAGTYVIESLSRNDQAGTYVIESLSRNDLAGTYVIESLSRDRQPVNAVGLCDLYANSNVAENISEQSNQGNYYMTVFGSQDEQVEPHRSIHQVVGYMTVVSPPDEERETNV